MHIAINGQVFWQSGTARFSSGQHDISSGIAAMDMSESAAIAGPPTGMVNGPATSPMIARIGNSLRSQMRAFMTRKMSQLEHTGKWSAVCVCRGPPAVAASVYASAQLATY